MIEHREPSLDVVTTTVGSQGRHTLSLHFTTDGNTRVNSVDGAVLESVASWEGSILRIESQLHTNEDEITVLERRSVDVGQRRCREDDLAISELMRGV